MAFMDPRYFNQETAQFEMMRAQEQLIRDQYRAASLAQQQPSSQATQLGIVAQRPTTPAVDKTLLLLGD